MNVQVLVVDDEHDVADLFRQQFRRELRSGKFLMDFAYSGTEALEYLTVPSDVQLILMLSDINMPGMTGLELLPKVRELRPDVPGLRSAMFFFRESLFRDFGMRSGNVIVMSKPLVPRHEVLTATIKLTMLGCPTIS